MDKPGSIERRTSAQPRESHEGLGRFRERGKEPSCAEKKAVYPKLEIVGKKWLPLRRDEEESRMGKKGRGHPGCDGGLIVRKRGRRGGKQSLGKKCLRQRANLQKNAKGRIALVREFSS